MDPNSLRAEIIRLAGEHEETGSNSYLEDKILAEALSVALEDVQRQIRILESNGLLDVVATFGPTYAARLTPQGELAFEQMNRLTAEPRKPVGF
jgi:Mn-dependent DtxR family transcriptional regulator